MNMIKLEILEPNLSLFYEILTHKILQKVISTFIGDEDYGSLITRILDNTYLVELPQYHHGLTLPNKSIAVDIKSVFKNPSHVSAYRLVILIHEFGHFFVRSKCTSFQQVLEYKSLEYSFEQCCSEKPLKRKKK